MEEPERLPRRKSPRIPDYDYSASGAYFITICVQRMESRFGTIEDCHVHLNDAGLMIASTWESNAERYPSLELDEYVVMPNHMHAIVFLGTDPEIESRPNLIRVVQSFKSITTVNYARGVRAGKYPAFDRILWQRTFHNTILESERSLEATRSYIEGNPSSQC